MRTIKIAIVEDDAAEAERLKNCIAQFERDSSYQFALSHFTNGLDFIEKVGSSFDIVFMDIEMPLMNGLEAAKRFREADHTACLIFVTKMAQLAVKGYEVNAMDFVVKPVKPFEFRVKMRKALAYCASLPQETVPIDSKRGFYRIDLSEIVYIEVLGHDLFFHTVDKNLEAHGVLKEYEEKFRGKHFSRCAKSFLVNLEHVVSYYNGEIELSNREKLAVSRAYKKSFANDLSRYLGEIYK